MSNRELPIGMGINGAPRWEATLLRRRDEGARARVAGRVVIQAPDAESARQAAEKALLARSHGEPRWSLGLLRPLSPMAPGTRRYRVTFAEWRPQGDGYARRDVHALEVWAPDAATARRLAHEEVRSVPGHRPSWRVRAVARVGQGARAARPRRVNRPPA
jgi:hypothetical protein